MFCGGNPDNDKPLVHDLHGLRFRPVHCPEQSVTDGRSDKVSESRGSHAVSQRCIGQHPVVRQTLRKGLRQTHVAPM